MKKLTKEQQRTLDDLLYDAAEKGKLFIVKFLIDLGADIHANNDSVLYVASVYGYFDIVKYFVECGANIHAKDDWAIRYAATKEIRKYLKSKVK